MTNKTKRKYNASLHLAWNDVDARREYNKLQMRAWRLRNAPRKGKRVGA